MSIENSEKIYHIYLKNKCIYPCLSESEFETIWNIIQKITWICEIKKEDLSYEELTVNKDLSLNSSY